MTDGGRKARRQHGPMKEEGKGGGGRKKKRNSEPEERRKDQVNTVQGEKISIHVYVP